MLVKDKSMEARQPIILEMPDAAPITLIDYYEDFLAYYPRAEWNTKQWFANHIGRDWIMIDAGANVGYYSILFARLAKWVYAFEPTSTVAMLRSNLAYNGVHNCDALKMALGDATGRIEEKIFRIWGRNAEIRAYDFTTLDDFMAAKNTDRLDCVKIDVDSFELELLNGARETIKRHDPFIVIEINSKTLGMRKHKAKDIFMWFRDMGYAWGQQLDSENYIFKRRGYDYRPYYDKMAIHMPVKTI